MSTVKGVLTVHRYAVRRTPAVLLRTRLSRMNFVIARVSRNNFVRITGTNKPSRHILATRRVIICNSGPCDNVFYSVPPRLSGRSGSMPSVTSQNVSMKVATRRTGTSVPLNDHINFTPTFITVRSAMCDNASVSSHTNVTTVLRTLHVAGRGRLPYRVTMTFYMRRRVKAQKTTPTAETVTPSCTVTASIDFTLAPSDGPRRYNRLNGNIVVNVSPVVGRRVASTLFSLDSGCTVPRRARIVAKLANASTSIVAIAGANMPATLLSVPLHCVRAPVRVMSVHSVRTMKRLVTTCVRRKDVTNRWTGFGRFVYREQHFQPQTNYPPVCS